MKPHEKEKMKPGARSPPDRGGAGRIEVYEDHPVLGRTASLPNVRMALSGSAPSNVPPTTVERTKKSSNKNVKSNEGRPQKVSDGGKTPASKQRQAQSTVSAANPPVPGNSCSKPVISNRSATYAHVAAPDNGARIPASVPSTSAARPVAPPSTRVTTAGLFAATRVQTPHPLAPAPRQSLAGRAVPSPRDPRLRTATVQPASPPVPVSPAAPRASAYDSPAVYSACSSRAGSSLSLASVCSEVNRDTDDPDTPMSPTPSTEDLEMVTRPQRRRRSSDEATEGAKRYCGTRSPQANTDACNKVSGLPINAISVASAAPAPAPADSNSAPAKGQRKKPRYPPLVVEKLPNWALHFRQLAAKLGRPPNARPYGSGVRFSPESEDEYRLVQRYLTALEKEEGVSWFAYSLPADKNVKVAIRGLPADTDPQEIEEELRVLGYEPEYVRHIRGRQGKPGCVFHVVLRRTEDVRRIYDTQVFLNMRGVKIEAWRGKRGPAQCHRCQKFRHSSHQCHRPLACVRCGEGHSARDCPRPREEPATCANCGGPHPACHVKCPVFQREIRNRRAGTVAITSSSTRRDPPPPPTQVQEHERDQGESLMAAANGPTVRGEATSSRRRKRRKGGRKGQSKPPATQQGTVVPKSAPPSKGTQVVKGRKGAQAGTSGAQQKRAPASTPSATTTTNSAPRGANNPRNSEITTCAIQLLMDLIKAIREGQSPEQVILDGLAKLLTLCHG